MTPFFCTSTRRSRVRSWPMSLSWYMKTRSVSHIKGGSIVAAETLCRDLIVDLSSARLNCLRGRRLHFWNIDLLKVNTHITSEQNSDRSVQDSKVRHRNHCPCEPLRVKTGHGWARRRKTACGFSGTESYVYASGMSTFPMKRRGCFLGEEQAEKIRCQTNHSHPNSTIYQKHIAHSQLSD